MTPTSPATGIVVDSRNVGHQVESRGPWLFNCVCGEHLPGPLVGVFTGKQCGRCARIAAARAKAAIDADRGGAATQGMLF